MSMEKDCNTRKDKQWCEWRKAKKKGKLTEHRREIKRQVNRNDTARQR